MALKAKNSKQNLADMMLENDKLKEKYEDLSESQVKKLDKLPEQELSKDAVDIKETVEEMTGVRLPRPEAATLAMHFINDRIQPDDPSKNPTEEAIERCTEMIEEEFDLQIDRESFNYSRFVTHLDYLLRRLDKNEQTESRNIEIYNQLKDSYPQSFECANKISEYVKQLSGIDPNDEEIMYLVVHINRLISRI